MKPVLKYRGGKSREIPAFINEVPNGFQRYLEPFFGGGALFFHLEPANAIVGDINSRLMTFYDQLRNQYPEMRRQLDALQDMYDRNQTHYQALKDQMPDQKVENRNEELFYKMRSLYNHPTNEYLEGVLYFFINKTAYSGMLRYNRNGEYNVPFGRYKNFNTKLITPEHSRLLQQATVLCTDYQAVFNQATVVDFMFIDPPYDCIFNEYGNLGTTDGFDEAAHRRLAADFANLHCQALMVIGKTPLTEGLYRRYICGEYEKRYAVNIRNRFRSEARHLIIKNY